MQLFVTAPALPADAPPEEQGWIYQQQCDEMLLLVVAAVAGCAGAGGLSDYLSVTWTGFESIDMPCWAFAGLRRLRELFFSAEPRRNADWAPSEDDAALFVAGPLSALPALEKLSLCAFTRRGMLVLDASAAFPAQLTCLQLGCLQNMESLPQQARRFAWRCWKHMRLVLGLALAPTVLCSCAASPVTLPALQIGDLTQLRSLLLEDVECDGRGWDVLSRLAGSLCRLGSTACCSLPPPATLAALTRLTALYLDNSPTMGTVWQPRPDIDQLLDAALRQAPQLRRLTVDFSRWAPARLPAALTTLSQLESLCWLTAAPAGCKAPLGAWLSQLQHLALPADVAAASGGSALLAAAPRLRWLALAGMSAGERSHALLVTAAAQHPTLHHLRLNSTESLRLSLRNPPPLPGFERVLAQAMRQKPWLTYKAVNDAWLSRTASFDAGYTMEEWEEEC